MPYKAKKPCPSPGCRELTNGGYCEAHKRASNAEYEKNARDKNATRHYHNARWDRLRQMQLGREPLCCSCKERGRLTTATHVDHIVEIADGGAVYDIDNLQSLCKPCHSSKTLRVRHARRGSSREAATADEGEREYRF